MHTTTKIRLTEMNPHLLCALCGGYLIDATTIIECLHSFCRSCIIRYLETSKYCPICDVQVHKTRPLLNIRPDRTLQNLVYKLVPGMYKEEIRRRREFLANHPGEDDTVTSLQLEANFTELDEPLIYSEDEKISLVLEHSTRIPPFYNNCQGVKGKDTRKETVSDRRFLLCPSLLTISLLKKFIRCKFDLNNSYKMEIFYSDESLNEDYTLMDVAYIYGWRRMRPLKLYYTVLECTEGSINNPTKQVTELPAKKQRGAPVVIRKRGRKRKTDLHTVKLLKKGDRVKSSKSELKDSSRASGSNNISSLKVVPETSGQKTTLTVAETPKINEPPGNNATKNVVKDVKKADVSALLQNSGDKRSAIADGPEATSIQITDKTDNRKLFVKKREKKSGNRPLRTKSSDHKLSLKRSTLKDGGKKGTGLRIVSKIGPGNKSPIVDKKSTYEFKDDDSHIGRSVLQKGKSCSNRQAAKSLHVTRPSHKHPHSEKSKSTVSPKKSSPKRQSEKELSSQVNHASGKRVAGSEGKTDNINSVASSSNPKANSLDVTKASVTKTKSNLAKDTDADSRSSANSRNAAITVEGTSSDKNKVRTVTIETQTEFDGNGVGVGNKCIEPSKTDAIPGVTDQPSAQNGSSLESAANCNQGKPVQPSNSTIKLPDMTLRAALESKRPDTVSTRVDTKSKPTSTSSVLKSLVLNQDTPHKDQTTTSLPVQTKSTDGVFSSSQGVMQGKSTSTAMANKTPVACTSATASTVTSNTKPVAKPVATSVRGVALPASSKASSEFGKFKSFTSASPLASASVKQDNKIPQNKRRISLPSFSEFSSSLKRQKRMSVDALFPNKQQTSSTATLPTVSEATSSYTWCVNNNSSVQNSFCISSNNAINSSIATQASHTNSAVTSPVLKRSQIAKQISNASCNTTSVSSSSATSTVVSCENKQNAPNVLKDKDKSHSTNHQLSKSLYATTASTVASKNSAISSALKAPVVTTSYNERVTQSKYTAKKTSTSGSTLVRDNTKPTPGTSNNILPCYQPKSYLKMNHSAGKKSQDLSRIRGKKVTLQYGPTFTPVPYGQQQSFTGIKTLSIAPAPTVSQGGIPTSNINATIAKVSLPSTPSQRGSSIEPFKGIFEKLSSIYSGGKQSQTIGLIDTKGGSRSAGGPKTEVSNLGKKKLPPPPSTGPLGNSSPKSPPPVRITLNLTQKWCRIDSTEPEQVVTKPVVSCSGKAGTSQTTNGSTVVLAKPAASASKATPNLGQKNTVSKPDPSHAKSPGSSSRQNTPGQQGPKTPASSGTTKAAHSQSRSEGNAGSKGNLAKSSGDPCLGKQDCEREISSEGVSSTSDHKPATPVASPKRAASQKQAEPGSPRIGNGYSSGSGECSSGSPNPVVTRPQTYARHSLPVVTAPTRPTYDRNNNQQPSTPTSVSTPPSPSFISPPPKKKRPWPSEATYSPLRLKIRPNFCGGVICPAVPTTTASQENTDNCHITNEAKGIIVNTNSSVGQSTPSGGINSKPPPPARSMSYEHHSRKDRLLSRDRGSKQRSYSTGNGNGNIDKTSK